jgi:hypothetical protein
MALSTLEENPTNEMMLEVGRLICISTRIERYLQICISYNFSNDAERYSSLVVFEKLQSNQKRIEFIDECQLGVARSEYWGEIKLNVEYFFVERNRIAHGVIMRSEQNQEFIHVNADKWHKNQKIKGYTVSRIAQISKFGEDVITSIMLLIGVGKKEERLAALRTASEYRAIAKKNESAAKAPAKPSI